MAIAPVAWADIYRWTDKDGNVNYSDTAPPEEQRIKDVVVVTRSRPPAPPATPTQQELLATIQNLEQQLQAPPVNAAPQVVAEPQVVAAPPPEYYAPPAPAPAPDYYLAQSVPPVTYYDAGYDGGTYDAAYSHLPYMYPGALVYVVTVYTTPLKRSGSGRPPHGRNPGHGPGGRGGARPISVR